MIELVEYVKKIADDDAPHVWGKDDCCVFASGAVEVMTGKRPLDKFTVAYDNERTGRALLQRHGGLARILTDLYGRSKQHGEIGYLAYSSFPDGSAVGIHMGTVAVFRGETGLVEVPLENCRFFKVI